MDIQNREFPILDMSHHCACPYFGRGRRSAVSKIGKRRRPKNRETFVNAVYFTIIAKLIKCLGDADDVI